MKQWLRLEAVCASLALRSRMAYRLDFALSFTGMFLAHLAMPVYIVLLYGVSQGFGEWTLSDMLLLTGFIQLARGVMSMFMSGLIWHTNERVHRGTFDLLLLAPVNSLGHLINRSIDFEDAGQFLSGLAVFVIAVVYAQISWLQLLVLLLLLPFAIAFFASLFIFSAAITVRYISTLRLFEFSDIAGQYSQFPLSIYPSLLGTVFLTLIPLGAAGYIPVGVVMGQLSTIMLGAMIFPVLFLAMSVWYWQNTLKHYTSAGG